MQAQWYVSFGQAEPKRVGSPTICPCADDAKLQYSCHKPRVAFRAFDPVKIQRHNEDAITSVEGSILYPRVRVTASLKLPDLLGPPMSKLR